MLTVPRRIEPPTAWQRTDRHRRMPTVPRRHGRTARLAEGQDDPARADALVAEALDLARPLPPDPANLIDRLTLTACLGDLGRREEGLAAMQKAVGLLDNAY